MSTWYVIQTKPQKERFVELLLTNAHFRVFNPKIKGFIKRNGGSVLRLKPFFPGYVFLHANFDDPLVKHTVRYTRGVLRILGNGGKPQPIEHEAVRMIMDRANGDEVVDYKVVFKPKDRVRIMTGPLKDLTGILENPVSWKERVRVLLDLTHYRVSLNWHELEKA